MLTREDINKINAKWRMQSPAYNAIMSKNRPEKKHRVFIISDNIYFEFWKAHEWEFTVRPAASDIFRKYMNLVRQMLIYADQINLDATKLPRYIAKVRKAVEALESELKGAA